MAKIYLKNRKQIISLKYAEMQSNATNKIISPTEMRIFLKNLKN